MKTHFCSENFLYDGSQLRPLFLYEEFDLLGDAALAWIGACDVHFDFMVDGEDKKANAFIQGANMVHFVFEIFRVDLASAVLLQRLFASQIKDLLTEDYGVEGLTREGDDLYLDEKKLSISIATKSANSCLIHFAVNVTNVGTPVPTTCLEDFGVKPVDFIHRALAQVATEWTSTLEATFKVHCK